MSGKLKSYRSHGKRKLAYNQSEPKSQKFFLGSFCYRSANNSIEVALDKSKVNFYSANIAKTSSIANWVAGKVVFVSLIRLIKENS